METYCCCAKYVLEEGEEFISNNILHQTYGKGRFCGPVINHELQRAKDRIKELESVLLEAQKVCPQIVGMWTKAIQDKE